MINPKAKIIPDEFPRDYQTVEDNINKTIKELEKKGCAIKEIDRKEDYTIIIYEE